MSNQTKVIGEFYAGFNCKGGGIVAKDGVLYHHDIVIAVKRNREVTVYKSPMASLLLKVASKLRYKVLSVC